MTAYSYQVIWTVLPNGVDSTGQNLKFSVHVAPRLTASDNANPSPTLQNWPAFENWPQTLANNFQFAVKFNGSSTGTSVSPISATPSATPWTTLFSPSTPVTPHAPLDLRNRNVWSYPATNIHQYTKNQYQQLITTFPDQHPSADVLINGIHGSSFRAFGGSSGISPVVPASLAPGGIGNYYPGTDTGGDPTPPAPRPAVNNGVPNNLLNPTTETELAPLPPGSDPTGRNPGRLQPKYTKWTGGGWVENVRTQLVGNGSIPNTGINPQTDFAQVYLYHQPFATAADTQGWAPPQHNVDFHEMLSHAGGHPTLMRLLGLVLDFEVPIPNTAPTTISFGAQGPNGWTETSPVTNCTYVPASGSSPALFVATSRSGDSDLVNGALQLNNGNFEVLDIDTDGAGMKMLNFASHVGRSMSLMQTDDTPTTYAPPHLRSPGFSVAHYNSATEQYQQISNQSALAAAAHGGQAMNLFAEDITRGYYIHVFSPLHGQWLSLGQRTGTYTFPASGQVINVSDEAPITMSSTNDPRGDITQPTVDGNSNDLTLSPHLFTWNGWSLAASHPGLSLNEGQTLSSPTNVPSDDFNAVFSFAPTPGTLPLLRYGQTYQFRARACDLAGNSLPFPAVDKAPDPAATAPAVFGRFEPIPQPLVLLTAPPTPGEGAELLVIRSNYNTTPNPNNTDSRHLVPPKMSQYMAELAGCFDSPTGIQQNSYGQITQLADGSLANIGGAQPVPGQVGNYYYPMNNIPVPYLPDAYAAGAALLDLPGTAPGTVTTAPFFPGNNKWPQAAAVKLVLAEGNGAPVYTPAGGGEGTLTVYIPKGQTAPVQLSSYLTPTNLNAMGHWQWILDANLSTPAQQALQAKALAGQMWAISPFREILLVHAVRQPLVPPQFSSAFAATKTVGGQTFADLTDLMTWDRSSTSKVHMTGQWVEYIDAGPGGPPPTQMPAPGSPANPETGDIAFDLALWKGDQTSLSAHLVAGQQYSTVQIYDLPQALSSGSVLILNFSDYVQELVVSGAPAPLASGSYTVPVQGFTANFSYPVPGDPVPAPSSGTVGIPGTVVTCPAWNATTLPLEQHHEFHDTKHRWVTYQATGTTAFAEYFYETVPAKLVSSGSTQVDPNGFVPGTVSVTGASGASPTNQPITGISFPLNDANHGWLVAQNGTMFVTRNGGSTWVPNGPSGINNFSGVSFPQYSNGWAIGQNGNLIQTTNYGLSWSALPAVQNNLNGVWFAHDDQTGWAVGQNGVIIATTDGGHTWSPQSSNTTADLLGVCVVGVETGFVVGEDGTILSTLNGGSSWTPLTSGVTQDLYDVEFISHTYGWAVGQAGTLLQTFDGGLHWAVMPAPVDQDLLSVSFANKQEGWIGTRNGQILMTVNGGGTWTQQPLLYNPATASITSTSLSAQLTGGSSTSSLPVTATSEYIPAGATATIGSGTIAPTLTVTANTPPGATTIPVSSYTPSVTIPPMTPVTIRGGDWTESDATGNLALTPYSAIPSGTTVEVNYLPEPITQTGGAVQMNILSSARPKAPAIVSVIPTFKWSSTNNLYQNITSNKVGGTLRVYLERPWWSSGEDEQLGVVIWHGDGTSTVPNPQVTPFVTQVGNDPVHASPQAQYQLSVSNFPAAVNTTIGTTLTEFGSLNHQQAFLVDVAGHAVHYDLARDLWYADIQVSAGPSYWPYIRLALCRYQPNSLANALNESGQEDDYFISPVRLADFIQTAPDRSTSVTQSAGWPVMVNVTMTGQSYSAVDSGGAVTQYDSSGNPVVPTNSGPSIVTVTLEQEQLNFNSDLAWGPATDAGGNPLEYVMTPQASGGLTSWTSSLTLPTSGGTFRLVIEEYETYASDAGIGERIVHTDVIYLGPQKFDGNLEVSGQKGTIVGSSNFGTTWTPISSGTTNDLYDVDVVSGAAAFAVGQNGTIITTGNGGSTWSTQTSGTTKTLSGVSFVSPTQGWVVGQMGTLLSTTNGGSTWNSTPPITTADLMGVCFIDAMHGWAAGKSGVILATTNGSSWVTQTTGTTQQLNGVSFVNDSVGWVVGNSGVILATTNGGSTWTAQKSGTNANLDGISMIDAQHGWVVGQNGTVLYTSNGGATWGAQHTWTTAGLNGVCFFNAALGLAVGNNGLILMTNNGGLAWAQPVPSNVNGAGVSFISPMQGFGVGQSGLIAMTTNGANDWSVLTSGSTQNLNGISFGSPTNGWAVGQNGTILTTSNGGQTWTAQASGTTQNLVDVSFIGATAGFVLAGNGTLLSTTNGGSTWSALPASGLPNGMMGLAFATSLLGWAVGNNGAIFATTNGGTTWKVQVSGIKQNLSGVSFRGKYGWAVGQNGVILNTSNGGATWNAQHPPTTQNLLGVSFTDVNNGFAFGAMGTVLATSNGGTTWNLLSAAPTTNNLLGVS